MSEPVFECHPEILSGAPVFVGTRVPVLTFIDYLKAGDSLGEFLEDFPGVRRDQAIGFLEQAAKALDARIARG